MAGRYVPRPAALRQASAAELLESWTSHRALLVDARHSLGEPQSPSRLAAAALDELAVGAALAEHVTVGRWVAVAEALTYGAELADVAAAMGLDVDEVTTGLRSWADAQLGYGLITAVQHDEVLALIG